MEKEGLWSPLSLSPGNSFMAEEKERGEISQTGTEDHCPAVAPGNFVSAEPMLRPQQSGSYLPTDKEG